MEKPHNQSPEKSSTTTTEVVDRAVLQQRQDAIKSKEISTTIRDALTSIKEANPSLKMDELIAQTVGMDQQFLSIFADIIWDCTELSADGVKIFNDMVGKFQGVSLIQRMISNARIINSTMDKNPPKDVLDQMYSASMDLDQIGEPSLYRAKPDEILITVSIPGKGLIQWRFKNSTWHPIQDSEATQVSEPVDEAEMDIINPPAESSDEDVGSTPRDGKVYEDDTSDPTSDDYIPPELPEERAWASEEEDDDGGPNTLSYKSDELDESHMTEDDIKAIMEASKAKAKSASQKPEDK